MTSPTRLFELRLLRDARRPTGVRSIARMGVRSSVTYQSIRGRERARFLAEVGGGRSKSTMPPASWIIRLSSSRSSRLSRLTSILPTRANRIGWLGDQAAE